MFKLLRRSIIYILVAFPFSVKAMDMQQVEDSVAHYHTLLAMATVDSVREKACNQMSAIIRENISSADFFSYPFEKWKFSKIHSSDGLVRIINWNSPREDDSYIYYCFILRKKSEADPVEWFELKDYPKEADKIENKFLNADKWLGALYYDIVPLERKKKTDTYVLFGWDGKDELTTRKVIDAVTFTGNKVRLGASIFPSEIGEKKRLIFEYSNEISMSVKYYPKKNCFVVDHLAPKNPMMTGIFADYGPDGTYDLYQLEKSKFVLYEKIDVSKFAAEDDKPYNDPRRRRR